MSHSTWTWRTALCTAAIAAATVPLAVPAQAAGAAPTHGSITFPVDQFDDPDTCASDGFSFHVVANETLLFNFLFDQDGQFVRGFAHHDLSFDFSANGKTIHESDHYNNTFAPDGTSTAAGNMTHVVGAHGEIILLDAGRIVFDQDKNPTFLAGQHPQLLGATFCSALMP